MANPFRFLIRGFNHDTAEDLNKGSLMVEKIDNELTDNMRALRLVATMSDHMLSRGMAVSDVVYHALGVTSTYCSRKVHIDINHTILTVSQDRGIDREPLTIVRAITIRSTDYYIVQALEELARNIRTGTVRLKDAETELDAIITRKPLYKPWVAHVAGGGISAGVVMLYSPKPLMWLIGLAMGTLVSITIAQMAKKGIPAFYTQALASVVIVVIAAITAIIAESALPLLDGATPTLIVISGIVMLVAGMTIVSAFQDAIDEYYVTATARLLKVIMMTGGIVVGVVVGLYVATRLGVQLSATPDRLNLSSLSYQYAGAIILAASFALSNHARITGVIVAGAVGFLSLYSTLLMTSAGVGVIPASGVAAMIVGFLAALLFRVFKVPATAIISAGIIPLVPGITLYSALIYIAQSMPNTADFDNGIALLTRAFLIAIAIAAGATFGNLLGRPAQIRRVRLENVLPHWRIGRRKPWTPKQ